MKISQSAKEKMKQFEGLRLTAYRCPAGVWTIGYGHTEGVKDGDVISPAQANVFFDNDIAKFEQQVAKLGLNLNQNQYDAVVSFAYNAGIGNLKSSTLFKKLKANPADPTIPAEFGRWVYAGGKVLQGLVNRRKWEAGRYEGKL